MLTKRIENMSPSKTMQVTAKSKQLKSQGFPVLDFSVGEPDFNTPDQICEAAKKAIDAGYTKYTLVNGITELREAICRKLLLENHVSYTPDQICVGTGAKQPLFNAIFAVCEEGDEVIIPTPGWVSYEEMVKLAGAEPVYVPCRKEENFELNIPAIAEAVSDRTKAIIINTPNNPTGAVYRRETLEELGNLALKRHFYIIVDEVYEKLVYEGREHFSIASISEEIRDNCILVNGFSKSYAMTGWRIGYAAANDEIIKAIKGIQSHTTSAGNSITQYAALEAYTGDQEFLKEMREEFVKRRNYLVKRINELPYVSCNPVYGAFYIMMDISETFGKYYDGHRIDSSLEFADLLLTHEYVALVPGEAFHADHYMRICYAVSMDCIREGMGRIERFLMALQ
ncbi:MAG: pyridoxal phosphate-dependent aminotransferase [Clostridiales bacterium]|nr:pyridoxal phosphate-dependent aminotransferase [Clostridiales bacterium]